MPDSRTVPGRVALGLPLAGQTAQNPLPNSELKEPAGKQVQFRLQTLPTSVQIYTCRQAGQGFAWVSDPDAILMNDEKTLLVHHYKAQDRPVERSL
jgi:hypothetical protein